MKRLIPFIVTTLGVLLFIGLVTAYRAGLFANVAGLRCEHAEVPATEAPDVA